MQAIALRRWHIQLHHEGLQSNPDDRLGVVVGELADGRKVNVGPIDAVISGRLFKSRGGQTYRLEGEPLPKFTVQLEHLWESRVYWDHPLMRSAGPLHAMVSAGCFRPFTEVEVTWRRQELTAWR